jgi:PAS domain S-box-containing protein
MDASAVTPEAAFPWTAAALVGAALVAGHLWYRTRRSRSAASQLKGLRSELSIRRLAEALWSARSEADLLRQGLEAMAHGTGIPCWAVYQQPEGSGSFLVASTLGLLPGSEMRVVPDPIGAEAADPASRAAWLGETQITTLAAGAKPPAATPHGLPEGTTIVSIPVTKRQEPPVVFQCFLTPGSEYGPEQRALVGWMASQVANALRRLRSERQEQLLASYAVGTGEILIGLDLEGTITHANAAAERALGAPPGALVGCPLDDLAVLDAPVDGASLAALARTAGDYAGDVWIRRGDGARFPAQIRISPVCDAAGETVAMVLVGRDVSERREREREIASRTEELARLNAQLERANQELEQARRLQNEFLANVSHELRTPLNAVIGFSTLLEEGADAGPEERREFVGSIRESARHLLTVINDLLDLAKAEAGRFQLRLVPGDLRDAVAAAVEAVQPEALRKGLQIRVEVTKGPLHALQDPARMRQVLLNVLGNAVKFTDRGEVRVRAWRDEATEEARIVVEDTGIGIARDRQARLFSKFGHGDSTYHRRHGGTGLGLSITRVLVENMGGTIQVESEGPNRGTRVTLGFPAPIGSLAC